MTREEFQTVTTEILSKLDDTGAVSERLDRLREAFGEQVTAAETNAATVAELSAKNESLQAANMSLYLKTGEKAEPENKEETPETAAVTFDELFDEKSGELK